MINVINSETEYCFEISDDLKKTLEEKIDSAIRNSVVTIEDGNIVCKKLFPPYDVIII